MKVSDCCGAGPRSINGDCDTEDFGICPVCRDHCEYVEEDDLEDNGPHAENCSCDWCENKRQVEAERAKDR